ncbi:MAG: GNAT family N-acetyltransferase [Patescibacteria group bacterium]
MIFCLANKNDALAVAQIHKSEIHKGFLSTLKLAFLKNLYLAIIESESSYCIIAKEKSTVVGFMSGVTDINKLYSYFLKKYFFQSLVLISQKFFSVSFLKKIFETLFYPVKEKKLPHAELLTMAVSNQFQGQGIAGKMFTEFIFEMGKRNIKSFKVLVGEELLPAINFYEKNRFSFLKNTTVHKGKSSRIYIYKL